MAHSDIFLFLNSITWIFFCFFFLYCCLIIFILPVLYKQLRLKIFVFKFYKKNLLNNVQINFNKFYSALPAITKIIVALENLGDQYALCNVKKHLFFGDFSSTNGSLPNVHRNTYTFAWTPSTNIIKQLNINSCRSPITISKNFEIGFYFFSSKKINVWQLIKLHRIKGKTNYFSQNSYEEFFKWKFNYISKLFFKENKELPIIDWNTMSSYEWRLTMKFLNGYYNNNFGANLKLKDDSLKANLLLTWNVHNFWNIFFRKIK